MKIFENNVFFIAYMNHVLFYNNENFDKELTREQIQQVKQFFNSKSDMELAPILRIISVIYNKYYLNDESSDEIKGLFEIFKMDDTFDKLMIFILKPNSNIEMDGGIPPKIRAMLWILLYTISLLLLTYVVNISKNSTVNDLLESINYIENIYKNSQECDISASHNNNDELFKRTINYLGFGLNNKELAISQSFLKSIKCFSEINFEKAAINKIFEFEDFEDFEDFAPVSKTGDELVPINTKNSQNVVVPMSNENSIVATNTDSTALVPANYKFDEKKIVETQILTYVRNGITDPATIKKLLKELKELKEITENPEKPASEKTTYELIYGIVIKHITQENIAALLTGNINYFIKQYDVTVEMIQDTIAKYNIALIKGRRMTDKSMIKIARGTRSLIFLVYMLITWYGYATICVTRIIVNINRIRILAITENLAIENNRKTRRAIKN